MTQRVRVGIAGTGSYVPERVVPNAWFEKIVDTSDEWIVQRTGIRERRYAAEDQATSDLAARAGRLALEHAGLAPEDLDLIVIGTASPDSMIPPTAPLVQKLLGARNAGAFDCNAACSGFLAAFNTAESFLAAGRARRALVIGAETLSRFTDFTDRSSCILFGDGAGAVVLRPWRECHQGEVLETTFGGDGRGYDFIKMAGGGSRRPATHDTVEARQHFIKVRGRDVFRFAVTRMADLVAHLARDHDPDDVTLVVPHQVNARIIQAAIERLGWDEDKFVINIERYGNTSSATVPLALDEARRAGRIEKGKLVILVAFGAGLTWGGALLRW
jgi:3-oxoacyl-[acyl-carrier-protein] synthase III